MIRVGCCGWGYLSSKKYFGEAWKKRFKSVLQCYSQLFDVVEINSTFYRIPRLETAEKWRNEADEINKKFEFTVKCNQIVTHRDRFKTKVSINIFNIMKEICKRLKANILLLQCPAGWKPTDENIKAFKTFLKKIKIGNLLLTWEPRGEWWEKPDLIKEICKDFNLIHCVDPLRTRAMYFSSKKLGYYRLHGFGKPTMYSYEFSKQELEEIKNMVIKNSYVFFNNMLMYDDGLEFKKLI